MATDGYEMKAKEAYLIADTFAELSAEALRVRVELSAKREISKEEAKQLEKAEDTLDSFVVLFRGYGIQLIGEQAATASKDLKSAVGHANETLKKISNLKQKILLLSNAVDLAFAVYKGDASQVAKLAEKLLNTKN